MASRSVRVLFYNKTGEPLSFVSENLSDGIYTEPWHQPPTIKAGDVGEWRTESDGFMTGTEGVTRYTIAGDGGTDFADLHWDNPFFGLNNVSGAVTQDFSGKTSTSYALEGRITGGQPPPNLVKMEKGDVEAWIDGVLAGPLYIFANANIIDDAVACFRVSPKAVSSPLFVAPPKGNLTSKVNIAFNASQWEGLWAGTSATVTISSSGGGNMIASVIDSSAAPPIQFQETFRFGLSGMALATLFQGVQAGLGGVGHGAQGAFISSVAKAMATREFHASPANEAVSGMLKVALGQNRVTLPESKFNSVVKTTVSIARIPRSSVTLSNGVCLTLYDEFEDGKFIGNFMHYERILLGLGVRLASQRLDGYPILH